MTREGDRMSGYKPPLIMCVILQTYFYHAFDVQIKRVVTQLTLKLISFMRWPEGILGKFKSIIWLNYVRNNVLCTLHIINIVCACKVI